MIGQHSATPWAVLARPVGAECQLSNHRSAVAELVRLPAAQPRPVPGRCQGMLTIVADDEVHLKNWADCD